MSRAMSRSLRQTPNYDWKWYEKKHHAWKTCKEWRDMLDLWR